MKKILTGLSNNISLNKQKIKGISCKQDISYRKCKQSVESGKQKDSK